MKLSFNTWLYGQANGWLPLRSLEDTVDTLAEIGYDGVEIGAAAPHAYPPFVDAERRAQIRRHVERRGMEVSALCPALGGAAGYNAASPDRAEREATFEYHAQCIELAHDLACEHVVWIAGWTRYGQLRTSAWEHAVDQLVRCAEIAEPLGVKLIVEPTSQVSDLTDNAGDVLRLMADAGVGNDVAKVMLDTIHVFHRRDDVRAQIREAGAQLGYMHLSDVDRLAPGDRTDFRPVIDELKLVGYDGWLTMEIGFTQREPNPDAIARAAHEYVSSILDPDDSRLAPWRTRPEAGR